MLTPTQLLAQQEHRPFPIPQGPWFSPQLWDHVLFYNVPVSPDALQATLPPGMQVDTREGQAWVSIVPFQLSLSIRGLPSGIWPFWPDGLWPIQFNELNVRTYVRVNDQPGVYFYSLDADDAFAVLMARWLFQLNYYRTRMTVGVSDAPQVVFASEGPTPSGAHRRFDATYQPSGPVFTPERGALADWLTSRWNFFCPNKAGGFIRGDIHHEPWPLQPAEVDIRTNTLLVDHGLPQPIGEPTLYYARRVHVLAWPKTVIR